MPGIDDRDPLANGVDDSEDFSSDEDDQNGPNMGQMRDLNNEEMDKLVQLQDITGIEDLSICRALLESKNWDLEATAVEQLRLQLPSEPSPPVNHDRPVQPPPMAPNARVIRPRRQHPAQGGLWATLLDWGVYFVTLPVTLPMRLTFGMAQRLFDAISYILGPQALPNAVGVGGSPVEDVKRFRECFERKYGLLHPDFKIGSYSQALEEAKKELKFLLVYLESPDHTDTDRYCSQTLCNPELCEFINTHNLLFWACSVETAEGQRVSMALRETTYPFLAVIVLRQGKMMLVGRVEGFIPPEELMERLEAIIRDNEAYIVAARADRAERTRNQSIREEQDQAFQETLRQDQERERKKREEEERKRQEEEEQKRLEQEELERRNKIKQMKIDLVNEIPEEPESSHPEVVRILIKLPGGQRLERRFLKTHTLRDLYLFVFCHPESPDEFDITTNFPKKVLECKLEDPNSPTFQEAGLGQSSMLFVHDLEA